MISCGITEYLLKLHTTGVLTVAASTLDVCMC